MPTCNIFMVSCVASTIMIFVFLDNQYVEESCDCESGNFGIRINNGISFFKGEFYEYP